jgi:hypothetical protein
MIWFILFNYHVSSGILLAYVPHFEEKMKLSLCDDLAVCICTYVYTHLASSS